MIFINISFAIVTIIVYAGTSVPFFNLYMNQNFSIIVSAIIYVLMVVIIRSLIMSLLGV